MGHLFPRQSAEWHPTLNENLTPFDVRPFSGKIVWWLCSYCGYPWQGIIGNRTRSNSVGCRSCNVRRAGDRLRRRALDEGRSLLLQRPDLAEEFHRTKNGTLGPGDVSAGDNRKMWWKCTRRGHEWEASPNNRTKPKPSGCPKCILYGTSETEIRLRFELAAVGCPVDMNLSEIPVSGRRPVRADISIPEYRIVVEFDSARYHSAAASMRRDRRQTAALREVNWTVIRLREEPLPLFTEHCLRVPRGASVKILARAALAELHRLGLRPRLLDRYLSEDETWSSDSAEEYIADRLLENLATKYPDVAKDWNYSKNGNDSPERTKCNSLTPVWWSCASGHSYRSSPASRVYSGSGCPTCGRLAMRAARKTPAAERSAGDLRPNLLSLWHPTLNDGATLFDFRPYSKVRAWWLCPICGDPWDAEIAQVGPTCRSCSYKVRGFLRQLPRRGRSLMDLHPDVAKDWDCSINSFGPDEVSSGSDITVGWKCHKCQSVWTRSVRSQVRSATCPNCN
ncbi:zinc-ribbon domain-containing protein [Nocardia heshunensis]